MSAYTKPELIKLQRECATNIKCTRFRVRVMAYAQINFASSYFVLLAVSRFMGTAFPPQLLVEDPNLTEKQIQSCIAQTMGYLWFSIPGVFIVTLFVLCASILLLKASEEDIPHIICWRAILYWQTLNSALLILDIAAIIALLKYDEIWYTAGCCIVIGRICFHAQVIRLGKFLEQMARIRILIEEIERFTKGENADRKPITRKDVHTGDQRHVLIVDN